MEFQLGEVQSTTEGYGFNVGNEYGAPIVSFEYPDRKAAATARGLIAKAIESVVWITAAKL